MRAWLTRQRTDYVGNERGTVTAEFAVVLPALVLVLILVVGTGTIGISQVRVYEAARAGAREAARGEPGRDVEAAAKRKAGPDSVVLVSTDEAFTKVQVSMPLPEVLHPIMKEVKARAEARTEGNNDGPQVSTRP